MQQSVRPTARRAPPRTTGAKAPPSPTRRRVSTPARIFYLLRWGYHFVTPVGMAIIIWGIVEASKGNPDKAWPLIVGGGIFTYMANYFNKSR